MLDNQIISFTENFSAKFEHVKNKKIALYGTGNNTHILTKFLKKDYSFTAILDRDPENTGLKINGISVISIDHIKEYADLIIIISNENYWDIIYDRIREHTEKYKIPVYFQDGSKPATEELDYENDLYWEITKENVIKSIKNNDIITFDIFDTLLMRKILTPEDIFSVIEKKIFNLYGESFDYARSRRYAATQLQRTAGFTFTLTQVYDLMVNDFDLPAEYRKNIYNLEIETERQFITQRKDVADLYKFALSEGKPIYLITDMYFPEDVIELILKENMISGYKKLYLSCNQGADKYSGQLWKIFTDEVRASKILHIGDNPESDGIRAEQFGIKPVIIKSAYSMFRSSSISSLAPKARNMQESLMAGMIMECLFNSPFALSRTSGKVAFTDNRVLGYAALGPVICGYLLWLISTAQKQSAEKILFFARDGLLLLRFYNLLIKSLKIKNAAKGVYLKTSRRAVTVPSLYSDKDINELVGLAFTGTFKEYLDIRFGISAHEKDPHKNLPINTKTDKSQVIKYLSPYRRVILESALKERTAYLKYIESLNLDLSNTICADTHYNGTNQYYLGKLLGKQLHGYYLCACTGNSNPYGIGDFMHGLYQGKGNLETADQSSVMRKKLIIESVTASPEGMYLYCKKDGRFIQAEGKMNQKSYKDKIGIHKGIGEFIKNFVYLLPSPVEHIITSYIIEESFGIFFSNMCSIDSSITDIFFADDSFSFNKDIPIWG